jgi:diguanylate cyclase (GGDEF)-like protein
MTNLAVVVHYSALLGLFGHFTFIPLFIWLDVRPMAAFNLLSCSIFLTCFWLNRRGKPHAAILLGAAEVTLHAVLAVLYTGWAMGFHFYIFGLAPLIFYSSQWRTAFKFSLLSCLGVIYVAIYLYALSNPALVAVSLIQTQMVGAVNIATTFLMLLAMAYSYRLAATQAESALQRVNQRLEVQALTDPLTRLANRRCMRDSLDEARDNFRKNGIPFSVIMTDIDDFKAFNDRYGHEAGDQVLIHVANLMRQEVRDQDHVARWGGEEFLVLVTGGNVSDACQVAERLRAAVASTPAKIAGLDLGVTMTLGVAEYEDEPSLTVCITRADDALYVGKRLGKNCVQVSRNGI